MRILQIRIHNTASIGTYSCPPTGSGSHLRYILLKALTYFLRQFKHACATSSVPDLDPDPHPDSLVRGTDPRIRIRTKMSQILNTGYQVHSLVLL
jgi:hypothetical protein